MTKTRNFTHGGKQYEIRAATFDHGWSVQVFRDGKAVSPPYTVTHETAIDVQTQGWGDAVDALMVLAQDDVENDRLRKVKDAGEAA